MKFKLALIGVSIVLMDSAWASADCLRFSSQPAFDGNMIVADLTADLSHPQIVKWTTTTCVGQEECQTDDNGGQCSCNGTYVEVENHIYNWKASVTLTLINGQGQALDKNYAESKVYAENSSLSPSSLSHVGASFVSLGSEKSKIGFSTHEGGEFIDLQKEAFIVPAHFGDFIFMGYPNKWGRPGDWLKTISVGKCE